MDRIASLYTQACTLQRKIYASLPWGVRLAHVLLSMDISSIEAWGRQLGLLMLQAGVEGMPDPGAKWNADKPEVRALPRGYMLDLAKKCYGVALKKNGNNPADAGDAMQDFIMTLLSDPGKIENRSLGAASSFILTGVGWKAGQDRSKKQNRREDSMDVGEGDEESTLDLVDEAFSENPYWNEDPNAFKKVEDIFPENVWDREVLPAVGHIHPDMMLYFQLLAQGKAGKHIIEQGLLPHFKAEVQEKGIKTPVQTWHARVQKARKLIHDIARKHSN